MNTQYFIDESTGLSIIVEQDGKYCVAEVLDLPGCVGEGSSVDEALAEVAFALEAVLSVIEEDEPDRYKELVKPLVTSTAADDVTTTGGGARLCLVA
jgi:predicted RNase H-like HicB family nuclease